MRINLQSVSIDHDVLLYFLSFLFFYSIYRHLSGRCRPSPTDLYTQHMRHIDPLDNLACTYYNLNADLSYAIHSRYIAIVHPIRAHILCSRTKIVVAIAIIWPTSLLLGLPTALFNQVRKPRPDFPVKLCMLTFPTGYEPYQLGYKLIELSIFFIGPVFIQTILYAIICKQLFVGTQELHRRTAVSKGDGTIRREKESDAIKARKGVVKMLIASVVVYFLSYAPAQVPLLYNVIFNDTFNRNWSFLVLIMILAYVNSAANPILYCIFSQNFRRRFGRALCACARRYNGVNYSRKCAATVDTSMGTRGVVRCSSLLTNTATTALMSEA